MTTNTTNLEIDRHFDCSKDALYNAWTNGDALKQWWHPMGKNLVNVVNDLRPSGLVKYVFNDTSLIIDGTYETVTPSELLVYTWQWHMESGIADNASYKLSVRFGGDEQSSSLTIKQEGFANAETLQPHKDGWEQGLDQLQEYVSQNKAADSLDRGTNQKPPISGYNETPEQEKVGGG